MSKSPAGARARYDKAFYDEFTHSSRRSAQIVLGKLFEQYRPSSVIDVGCGVGAWLSIAQELGAHVVGQADPAGLVVVVARADHPRPDPADSAVGAQHATRDLVLAVIGDGSIMMNLQELQTIVGRKLPVKLFILNNDGYHSIRQSQQNHFPDNIVGCGTDSGLTFPDFVKLAGGFSLEARRVDTHAELSAAIRATLDSDGPQMCEVVIDKVQEFSPKLSSRKLDDGTMVSPVLEDLSPFLPREELAAAMA